MAEVKILLICDNETIARYLREKLIVSGGYLVSLEYTPKAGIETFKEEGFDIAIVKLTAVDLDNAQLIKELKKIDPDCIIIAFTEDGAEQVSREAVKLGIYDFINKPINLEKLFFIIKKGVQLRILMQANRKLIQGIQEQNVSLQKQNNLLARRIEESTKNLTRLYEDLRSTYMRTIKALAQAIDARDHYTHSHSQNVAKYAVIIAEAMRLSASDIELIRDACELHDLGKIGVDDHILGKSSELTQEEWAEIKKHPLTAAHILEPLTFMNNVVELVTQHHEHYDGSGYPQGLRQEEIAPGARIIHLADAYDAMRSARSYRKKPLLKEQAIEEIKKYNGTQFDPKVVEAFLKITDKL